MNEFKVCDLVTPIDTSFYSFKDSMEDLVGKLMVVTKVLSDGSETNIRAGVTGGVNHYWRPDDLRLVCAAQPKSDTLAYLKEQSEAWLRIVKTLDEVYFDWNDTKHSSCDDAAVAAIQKLARKAKQARKAKKKAKAARSSDAATKQNPLKCGDLVTRYGGSICVVVDVSAGGSCWVHPIAGEGSQDYFHFEELTKVGSVRKKAKRLLKQMECEK